jgi:hypothetical protein
VCSCTIRTARSPTSAEYVFGFVIPPTSQELEPPAIPAWFTFRSTCIRKGIDLMLRMNAYCVWPTRFLSSRSEGWSSL